MANIESTPVVGVETRKDKILDFVAPSFSKEEAKGITPQEQTGRGTPKIVALIIDKNPGLPNCLLIKLLPKNTWSKPAINIPKRR